MVLVADEPFAFTESVISLTSPTTAPPPAGVNGLGALLRRGWIALTVSVILGLVAGVLLTNLEQPKYTASASVYVTSTGVSDTTSLANSRTSGTINLDTEAQLAHSTQVAERVQELDPARKSTPPQALLSGLTISVPANTQVLKMSYTAHSATSAAQVANDFAKAYLAVRFDSASATLNAQIKKISGNLKTLNSTLAGVIKTLAGIQGDSKTKQINNSRKQQLVSQINSLTTQYSALSTTVVTGGQPLSDATVPSTPTSPSLVLNVAAGLACGLLVGLAIAWFRFARLRRMSRPDDVVRLIHLPVAGTVEQIHTGTVEPSGSVPSNQYQRIVNLLNASVGKEGVILLTGAASNAPTDTVAANIAAAMARSAVHVSLLSLTGQSDRVITEGTPAVTVVDRDTSLAIAGAISRSKLDEIRRGGVLIVTAVDPASSADAQTLATVSDAVLVIVAARTKVRDGRAAVDQLDAVGAPVLGAVLVPGEKSTRPTVLSPGVGAGRSGAKGHRAGTAQPTIESGEKRAAPRPNGVPRPGRPRVTQPAPSASALPSGSGGPHTATGAPAAAPPRAAQAVVQPVAQPPAQQYGPVQSPGAGHGNGTGHGTGHSTANANGAGHPPAPNGASHPAPAGTRAHSQPHPDHDSARTDPDAETLPTETVSVSALVRARSRAKFDRSSRR